MKRGLLTIEHEFMVRGLIVSGLKRALGEAGHRSMQRPDEAALAILAEARRGNRMSVAAFKEALSGAAARPSPRGAQPAAATFRQKMT